MNSASSDSSSAARNVKRLSWFNFCSDFRLYSPIAILYFSEMGGSFARGSAVFAIVMVASAAFEVPTGIWSDRVGRRRTLLAGALASFVSVTLYALAASVRGSFVVLVFGALLEGLSRSLFSGNNDALLYES